MLQMPMIFGDRMVLQRQKPMELWGEANSGETVSVSILKGKKTVAEEKTRADVNGQWRIFLPAQEAMRGLTLTVTTDCGDTLSFSDVLIGEVWIAGGQSNMEYFLQFDGDRDIAFAREEDPDIRFFDYPDVSYEGELEDYYFSEFGLWRRCRREDLPWYSAVAYWFAARLREDMDVPVGIVGCNWGGTRACCWMDRQRLEGTPGAVWLREYENGIRDVDPELYRKVFLAIPGNVNDHPVFGRDTSILYPGFSKETQEKMMAEITNIQKPPYFDVIGPDNPWRPCGLYETMLTKVTPYTCRGVLWYQGESDEPHPEIYDQLLAILTRNWRDLWHDELPFLMVQLAPFGWWMGNDGARFPILRDRQERAAREIPSVWLASSSDAGMEWDIHPKHKRPIGERLALLALGHVYGQEILCEAPAFESAAWAEGVLTISFQHSQGLHLKENAGAIPALLVDGAPVQGCVEDEKLVLRCPVKPSRVAYAQTGYYESSLYNGAGIPAIPFAAEVV